MKNLSVLLYHWVRRQVAVWDYPDDPDSYAPPLYALPLVLLFFAWVLTPWRKVFEWTVTFILVGCLIAACWMTLAWASIYYGWGL